jgi:hypothetical protein
MSNEPKDCITLGADIGGPQASDVTVPQFMPLRKFLASMCTRPYSTEVDEFALILRIDGNVAQFHFEGCERMRRSRKGRYVTIDIGVPESRWKDQPAAALRTYLMDCVRDALRQIVAKLKKDKTDVDEGALFADVDRVAAAYLAGDAT